jgi:hypothetical protein
MNHVFFLEESYICLIDLCLFVKMQNKGSAVFWDTLNFTSVISIYHIFR